VSGGRTVYVFDGTALNFRITAPTSGGANNFEGIALTDVSGPSNVVLDFYTLGGGGTITASNGHASGATSTTLATNVGNTSVQIDANGNVTQSAHTRGGIPCFVAGSQVMTSEGLRPVEDILPGDQVLTMDRGFRTVTWTGRKTVKATGRFAPVVIRKGTLGAKRDLWLSPQHRVLLTGWEAEVYFGREEVLVPAIALGNCATIVRRNCVDVTYVHLMFDRHQVIYSERLATESFLPGPQIVNLFDQPVAEEICALFPELDPETGEGYGATARPSLKAYEGRLLAAIQAA